MKKIITIIGLALFSQGAFGQLICGDTFTDSGGSTGDYSSDESDTVVICPGMPGNVVQLVFSSFEIEFDYDFMYIYEGNSVAGQLLGTYTDLDSPGTVVSEDASGCLTVVFTSDNSVTLPGWEATINCIPPPSCLRPTNVSTSNISDSDAQLNWTSNGSEAEWIIEYGPDGFTLGSGTSVVTSTNPVALSGLNQISPYDVYIRAICGVADTSNYFGPVSFTTTATPLNCGDAFTDTGGPTGDYSLNQSYTVTACPSLPGETVEVVFSDFDIEDGWDFMTIYDGPDTNASVIGVYTGTTGPGTLVAENAGGCLTFKFVSDDIVTATGWIAQINCITAPTCLKPTNLAASNATNNSIDLSWTSAGSETSWLIEYGAPGFTTGTGNTVIASSNPFTVSGLAATSPYDFYVVAICGPADSSNYSLPATGMTINDPFICGNLFVDNGGANNDYNAFSGDTIVICPDNIMDTLRITFTSFSTEDGYDSLMVFDGNSTGSPLIGTFQGTNSPGVITASTLGGCLTFLFMSDGSFQDIGWEATIECIPSNLGLNETTGAGLTIYPNPSKGIFKLENNSSRNLNFEISDVNGRTIAYPKQLIQANQELNLNLSTSENGVYFIRVYDEVSTTTYRLVKN